MAKSLVVIGPVDAPYFVFEDTNNTLLTCPFVNDVDVIGIKLAINTLTPRVQYPYTRDSGEVIGGTDFDGMVTSDGYLICTNKQFLDIRKLDYGTEIRLYRRGALYMKMYYEDAVHVVDCIYKINTVSAIGILDGQKHYGGFYDGVAFKAMLEEIIGDTVPYTVSDAVANIPVRGYLPYQSKRKNLHWLTMAYGVMVGRNADGDMDFRFISNKDIKSIDTRRFYGPGSVGSPTAVSAVDVTEHSYMNLPTDETVTVYDNTDGSETANNTVIVFPKDQAPLHDLEVTGSLTIVDSGVNWAIVSGTGVLTGKKYTHSTRILTRYADNTRQREKVAPLEDNTLVNVTNSVNVAKRLLAYYAFAREVKVTFTNEGEQCGEQVTGVDPKGDTITGFLSHIEGLVSASKIKAVSKLISGYVPTGQGNNYTRSVMLTGEGDIIWDELLADKDDDDTVQLQLISGGHGGYSGEDGKAATSNFMDYGYEGEGGEGGDPGEGGKVLTITLKVSELRGLVSHYSCGEGGESDQEGGETTILGRSSSEGAVTPYGVANLFTGEIYGLAGTEKGTPGGKGVGHSAGGSVSFEGQTWAPGGKGDDTSRSSSEGTATAQGGFGGGAAVGSNGGAGKVGEIDSNDYYNKNHGTRHLVAYGGAGGVGASAAARNAARGYGEGGPGGHGGGGGGIGGKGTGTTGLDGAGYGAFGHPGQGGSGGKGGKGGPGLISIYI